MYRLPQTWVTNALAQTLMQEIANTDNELESATSDKMFKISFLPNSKHNRGPKQSTIKLLDYLLIKALKDHTTDVKFDVCEYMIVRNVWNKQRLTEQIRDDLAVINSLSLSFTYKHKEHNGITICKVEPVIDRSIVKFQFSDLYYSIIQRSSWMYIPKEYFSCSDKKNPNTAAFLRRISLCKHMNLIRKNADVISVKTLVASSPSFPKESTRYKEKNLGPFIRDMSSICIIDWEFRERMPTSWHEFMDAKIGIKWEGYPDVSKYTERLKALIESKKTRQLKDEQVVNPLSNLPDEPDEPVYDEPPM